MRIFQFSPALSVQPRERSLRPEQSYCAGAVRSNIRESKIHNFHAGSGLNQGNGNVLRELQHRQEFRVTNADCAPIAGDVPCVSSPTRSCPLQYRNCLHNYQVFQFGPTKGPSMNNAFFSPTRVSPGIVDGWSANCTRNGTALLSRRLSDIRSAGGIPCQPLLARAYSHSSLSAF